MSAQIRLATEADAAQILAIYSPNVTQAVVSFELEPPTLDEMRRRIRATLQRLPWLVCDASGEILGYAYASAHRERAAYQWSVDVSAYVHADARRAGVGRALYTSLVSLLATQGFYNAYAGITLPNPASVGLHEAIGFRPVGVYRQVGYKFGAWHDVGWWHLELQPHAPVPATPIGIAAVLGTRRGGEALAAGLPHLRLETLQPGAYGNK